MTLSDIKRYLRYRKLKRQPVACEVMETEEGMTFQFTWSGGYVVDIIAPNTHDDERIKTTTPAESYFHYSDGGFRVELSTAGNVRYLMLSYVTPVTGCGYVHSGANVYAYENEHTAPQWRIIESHPQLSQLLGNFSNAVTVKQKPSSKEYTKHEKENVRWTAVSDHRLGAVVILNNRTQVKQQNPRILIDISTGIPKDDRYRINRVFEARGAPRSPCRLLKDNTSGVLRGRIVGVVVTTTIDSFESQVQSGSTIAHIRITYDTNREDLYQVVAARSFDWKTEPFEMTASFWEPQLLGAVDFKMQGITKVKNGV